MSRVHQIVLAGLLLVVAVAPVARAQDRPVAFIHGLRSTGETWQSAADALQQQLALQAHRPNPSWVDTFQDQAAQVQNEIGGLPSSTIAVGHSNGGVVSRQWSKMRYLDGLVTLGTPNHGAPLVDNIFHFTRFSFQVYDRILDVFDAFSDCSGVWECAEQWSWVLRANDLDDWLLAVGNFILNHPWEINNTLGFMNTLPVLPQMAVQSPFMQDLNSNVGSEQTGTRVGMVSIARNWYDAGWWRVVKPDSADTVAYVVDFGAALLDLWSTYIYVTADPGDNHALSIANKMTVASGVMIAMDSIYCRAVSSPNMGPTCLANDTVVPDQSQRLPNSVEVVMNGGPVHIRETTESTEYLYQVLANVMSISPRSGGGGGGGPMQPNSAIVGCSNWYWLDPVYRADAASCYSYCQQYGADACEWASEQDGASNPGDCYVEYGDGCTVASGYSAWSAIVLNLGGPPAGGGGGDGQMHSNSAVRGCSGWSWWDPAYLPTAEACATYCVQNNADACEWYTNGECYVEFGRSCYVEPGYAGWSAMVLR
jgi:pimeloyl-ACP methyl ester carboxylesterase